MHYSCSVKAATVNPVYVGKEGGLTGLKPQDRHGGGQSGSFLPLHILLLDPCVCLRQLKNVSAQKKQNNLNVLNIHYTHNSLCLKVYMPEISNILGMQFTTNCLLSLPLPSHLVNADHRFQCSSNMLWPIII